jgi:hypothetical protein
LLAKIDEVKIEKRGYFILKTNIKDLGQLKYRCNKNRAGSYLITAGPIFILT